MNTQAQKVNMNHQSKIPHTTAILLIPAMIALPAITAVNVTSEMDTRSMATAGCSTAIVIKI